MRLTWAGLAAVLATAFWSAARAEAPSSSCLVINNSRASGRPITVEIDGYESKYWALQANETYTVFDGDRLVRGARFDIRVYDGDERRGSKGALFDTIHMEATGYSYGSALHAMVTLISPPTSNDPRAHPDCRGTGYWLANIVD